MIMPTRNRADMFKRALDSVLAQTGAAFEVVVVNDGTSGTEAAGLDRVKAEVGDAARFIDLPVTQSGHGCFRVMNTGAVNSTGDYLCFLDDDDMWVDAEHLADADRVITRAGAAVDAVFFDQVAYRGDVIADGPIWLEDLGARLRKTGDNHNGFEVDATTLLSAHGFAHTNTVIVRRSTFLEIGGFDTKLWYEGDRDFFLRLLDASSTLLYRPDRLCQAQHPGKRGAIEYVELDVGTEQVTGPDQVAAQGCPPKSPS